MSKRRCAIYTRKSTEEGLEQAFNSLNAQREACSAYILSQAHEGWEISSDYYDDGGWSGGNIERPALKQLLADVEAGKIDVIVVYKVDRLTRSLADFARIVDILDTAGASFVSVTQAFNTTNSMGRLTLNVLLSFAQFEREVTSERIRDKIAASKRKGMWMGGPVPLGYRINDRRLIIDETEAPTVRMLFQRYVDLCSITKLVDELASKDIRTKVRQYTNGRLVGGVLFMRGTLSQLLQNPLYMGKVRHQNSYYEGEHDALIDEEIWLEVQRVLDRNRAERRHGKTVRYPSLLTGMLTDPDGRPMTPVFTSRGAKRYHYYVTRLRPGEDSKLAWRVPAGELDRAVVTAIEQMLRSKASDNLEQLEYNRVLADTLPSAAVPEQRRMISGLGIRASLTLDKVSIRYPNGGQTISHELQTKLVHRGQEKRLVLGDRPTTAKADPVLLKLVAMAQSLKMSLNSAMKDEVTNAYSKRHRWQLLRVAYLAPDIIAAIVDGRHPPSLTGRRLLRATGIPLDWNEQRSFFGFN